MIPFLELSSLSQLVQGVNCLFQPTMEHSKALRFFSALLRSFVSLVQAVNWNSTLQLRNEPTPACQLSSSGSEKTAPRGQPNQRLHAPMTVQQLLAQDSGRLPPLGNPGELSR